MRKVAIFFCAVLFLIAGCAQVPIQATFPYASGEPVQREASYFYQQQLQSATHWQLIAKLTTERLSSDPDLLDFLKSQSGGSPPRISIQSSDKSPFGQAFRGYLITELKNAHFLLSETPDGPINLRWSTQLVNRNKERVRQFLGVPASIVLLVGTILFGNGWHTGDYMIPHTEVVLTTRVTIGEDSVVNTIKSYSDIFYINDGDGNNYYAAATNAFSRSIAGKDEAWRIRLAREGWLSQ